MTEHVYIDRIDQLEATERYGVVVRLVRRARVIGLDASGDYQVLMEALTEAGIPASMTPLTGAPNLVLVERNPKLNDDRTVDVDLIYEHALNEAQDLNNPPFGIVIGECQASLNQVTSNLDENAETITVQHTYPADDADYPNQLKKQGGEIQFFQPQLTLKYQGAKFTISPLLVARSIVGCVNSRQWGGGNVAEWICTAATWKFLDVNSSPNRYLFTFEFQFNPDGWSPTVVFIDDRTGKPPANLVEGVGYKKIDKHVQVDFEAIIGARVASG